MQGETTRYEIHSAGATSCLHRFPCSWNSDSGKWKNSAFGRRLSEIFLNEFPGLFAKALSGRRKKIPHHIRRGTTATLFKTNS